MVRKNKQLVLGVLLKQLLDKFARKRQLCPPGLQEQLRDPNRNRVNRRQVPSKPARQPVRYRVVQLEPLRFVAGLPCPGPLRHELELQ